MRRERGGGGRTMDLAMAIVIHELMKFSDQVGQGLIRSGFGGAGLESQVNGCEGGNLSTAWESGIQVGGTEKEKNPLLDGVRERCRETGRSTGFKNDRCETGARPKSLILELLGL
ncbi:hypothetical protein SODALDRAFT_74628 [Sodiomyces alkalinus F11]|uniref:Uncharacterized protein n=1 Tax=Sodiomyces alkalinus (strain CBS 110278 / VKM F-3762 / F11) TaxID=1314773 RepID=A0A3N2PK88_SODAK|nr:hypothetical protein SODALDRAFT_74628 [Sodiomyces alkalinus F11]ROT34952.1 hypothetical protein SODALDRAFT_74628 [Sodiomyces alkalinus F11]